MTRGETSSVRYSRQAWNRSAGVATPITRSPWAMTQSVSRSVLPAAATAALTTGAGIRPEFAAMTERPEAPKPLVDASERLVQMSMAITRLILGLPGVGG